MKARRRQSRAEMCPGKDSDFRGPRPLPPPTQPPTPPPASSHSLSPPLPVSHLSNGRKFLLCCKFVGGGTKRTAWCCGSSNSSCLNFIFLFLFNGPFKFRVLVLWNFRECFSVSITAPQKMYLLKFSCRIHKKPGLLELGCRRRCFWNILLAAFVICCGSFLSLSSVPSYVSPRKTPPHPLRPRPGLVFGVGLKEAEERREEERNAPAGLRLPLISTCETNELNYEQLCLFSSLPSVCGDPPRPPAPTKRKTLVGVCVFDLLGFTEEVGCGALAAALSSRLVTRDEVAPPQRSLTLSPDVIFFFFFFLILATDKERHPCYL